MSVSEWVSLRVNEVLLGVSILHHKRKVSQHFLVLSISLLSFDFLHFVPSHPIISLHSLISLNHLFSLLLFSILVFLSNNVSFPFFVAHLPFSFSPPRNTGPTHFFMCYPLHSHFCSAWSRSKTKALDQSRTLNSL